MDQKRLFMAIAISLAILVGFEYLIGPYLPHPPPPKEQTTALNGSEPGKPAATAQNAVPSAPGSVAAATLNAQPKNVPRVQIDAPSVRGSISLLGARLDDLILTHYRETLKPDSPDVKLLSPPGTPHPDYVQYGWTAAPGETVKVPGNNTLWTASAKTLTPSHPVTLSWDNGQGLTYQLILSVDDRYMFTVKQAVKNTSGQPVKLFPWKRVRRDYEPPPSGEYILFVGMLGVVDNTLKETTYANAQSEAKDNHGIAYTATAPGGWAGFTDKYWLTAMIPDQSVPETVTFHNLKENGTEHYQVDYITKQPETIAPGAESALPSRLFTGAKVVRLLDAYGTQYHIPSFDKAVDWGWFYFLTKPIFYCLDWLNALVGNFGIAIMLFTVGVKALFFPLANYSYRSMSKMKLLGPKMTALREKYKDDPQKMQSEMMAMYKAEKVNPASGCLPMVVQIPVFFSLYKVIFVTIEMRQAPFFGWIHDLSAIDPTNVFRLFGLLPWHPGDISPFLHLGAWPL
ncbi:MAG TPA: membrane protein insertase YidC, partial [Acetobacteraceae bacterium]|nr:membrane protein insertase YidC [Acetobacteraceae bacterium]